ncbi:hypothetical protein [uncultured Kordia sp.]|uniref:hypothetical protein n=1 Tax=uncultured Kordia sp. TaxID=507699 RepID=UPI0026329E5A|nr:hypothetical protein [uncultured Kordia sp.]
MELNDLKTEWKKSDSLLESNLIIDSQKLSKRKLNRSKSEMTTPFLHEIANIIVVSITVLAALVGSILYINEMKFSIPGFIAAIIGSVYLYLAITKAIKISKIDYFTSTIIEIQKEISQLSLLVLKFRKLELILFPLFIVSILPITFIAIQNRDLYNDLHFFLFEIIFIIGFGFIGIFWINKNLYDKKIERVKLFLQELINEKDISITNS